MASAPDSADCLVAHAELGRQLAQATVARLNTDHSFLLERELMMPRRMVRRPP
jgi:hypothetical protein